MTIRFGSHNAERLEQVRITARLSHLNRAAWESLARIINGGTLPPSRAGDRVDVRYTLDVAYLGDVPERLEAVLDLATRFPNEFEAVAVEELREGRILFLQVAEKLEAIAKRIEDARNERSDG